LTKFNNTCCSCNCKLESKGFHLDHIKPLTSGGTNDESNIQILCKDCHMMKSKEEQENHEYVKISETASSFNQQVFDIMTDKLTNVFSFVETVKASSNKQNTIFKIDMNKSRKNSIYYSKHDFPLFTVMDEVQIFKPFINSYDKPGLYHVETDQYFPMRGNGFYSHVMVKYCMENLLINESYIKYVIYNSLTIPKEYFNPFIDYIYTNFNKYAKQIINTMIGIFTINTKRKNKNNCYI